LNAGRPKSGHNPSNYTFSLWEENKAELEKLKTGRISEEINIAIKNHFKFKNSVSQDIEYQIEKEDKIITRHLNIKKQLEEEIGKQKEKEKEKLENKDRELKEIYLGFCSSIKLAFNPYYFCDDKKANGEMKEKYGINVDRKLVDRILNDSFSFEDYVGVVNG